MIFAAAALGATLYTTNCSSCHGQFGQGSNVAPPLIGDSAVSLSLPRFC
jgi:mono/diheme cytochrome c family protein